MAAELSFLPLNQHQNQNQQTQLHQHPLHGLAAVPGAWIWNPTPAHDDDSWEVRAFAEDTVGIMGTTWPPRSYTCTFCRREFRSAQALGGHMNVHRRERARLHQTQPAAGASTSASSTLFIPSQEFASHGGLCLLYQLPNPNGVFAPTTINACSINAPSTVLSVSPFSSGRTSRGTSANSDPVLPPGSSSSINDQVLYRKPESSMSPNKDNKCKEAAAIEELDLELRLGQGPTIAAPS